MTLSRRNLIQAGCAALAAPAFLGRAWAAERRFAPQVEGWRSFEISTTITLPEASGVSRIWLPVPDVNSDYQRSGESSWTGNATVARIATDSSHGTRMLYAEFAADVAAPTLTLKSLVQTRNRAVDWTQTRVASEDAAVLQANLAPTSLLPVDGVVRDTARAAIGGATTDVDKVRAIYQWVVDNAFREPTTRGCGTGDIKTMLESKNLGGKCADLNAVFVGLCRAVGVPARDVYGLRLAPSAFGYKELGGNSASLKGAQHCRAEVFLQQYGWVAMDPADVLKVMRQETPEWIKDKTHPVAAPVASALFGGWEGNWVGWNNSHDLTLPNYSRPGKLPFLMYPQGENAAGRFDELAPDSFRYTIAARETTV
ncbi:transglutaminase [Rhodoferax lacus]|uniref:Transglutaminase n=1 Tax=Rhodoferax lacus TaxID=2184758 RepID=A0A3E1R763_9BURK|nr:transglutaminase domain-containing protein [Rhodoferax lacus]RFO95083.1 transglutaminase [Rhodoferax lacus]